MTNCEEFEAAVREEFEAAVRKDFEEAGICEADLRKDESGQYVVDVLVSAWWAWQQAFSSAAAKVLEVWEREGVPSLRAENTELHATLQAAKRENETLLQALKSLVDMGLLHDGQGTRTFIPATVEQYDAAMAVVVKATA